LVPGLFTGVKRTGRGVDQPQCSAEIKESVELYLYSTSGPSWSITGRNLPLTYQYLILWKTRLGKLCGPAVHDRLRDDDDDDDDDDNNNNMRSS